MQMRRNVMKLAAIVWAGFWFQAAASLPDDPQKIFAQAKQFYQDSRYDSTARLLRAYIEKNGKEESNEYMVPLLAEALVRNSDNGFVHRLVSIYKKRFPQSVFLGRMWYIDAVAFAKDDEFEQALVSFSAALHAGLTPALDSLAQNNIRLLCENGFAAAELGVLAGRNTLHPRIVEIMKYYEIVGLYKEQQSAKARQEGEIFKDRFPQSPFLSAIKELAAKAKKLSREQLAIGLLAPLSGDNADVGRQVVQGVQLAIEQHNATNDMKLLPIICDTRSSMVETAVKTRQLLDEHNLSLIIGPVLSQDAVVSAAMLLGKRALMISPTATDDGISDLGPNIFQMNVTLGSLGSTLANYAMTNLNIREFVIFSPTTGYGLTLSSRFKGYVERNGGEIVAEEYFDEGSKNLAAQFASLRSALIQRKREAAAQIAGLQHIGSNSGRRADSLLYADSTLEVGGMFIPAEPEDVVMIAPQVFFHRIRTQLLGCTGWHSNKTILDGKRYVNNAIISTNLPAMRTDAKWEEFARTYKKRFNCDADRVCALGYDALNLLITAINQNEGNADPEKIARILASISGYDGLAGRVSFNPESRSNTEAAIVKISDKKFVQIQ